MKKLFFYSLLSFIGLNTQAQVRFGIEAGANYSNYNFTVSGGGSSSSASTDAVVLYRAGLLVDCGITNNFSFQPGLLYVANGFTLSSYGVAENATVNTVEIPLYLLYKFGQPGGGRFFFGVGPYVGYNISGNKSEVSPGGLSINQSMNFGSDKTKDDMQALDYGVGGTIGYELGMGLFFRLHYQMGLANLAVDNSGGASIESYNMGATVGFLFGGGGSGKEGKHKIGKVKHNSRRRELPWY